MPDNFWSDADIIDSYTRRQAIENGVLVQLSGPGYEGNPWVPDMVAEAGFRFPVAMTATVFCRYVAPLEGDGEMLTFPKRPRRDQTIAADRKLWTSKCRRYRVTFSRCCYGPRDERDSRRVLRPTLRPGVWNMGCAVETSKPTRRRKPAPAFPCRWRWSRWAGATGTIRCGGQ